MVFTAYRVTSHIISDSPASIFQGLGLQTCIKLELGFGMCFASSNFLLSFTTYLLIINPGKMNKMFQVEENKVKYWVVWCFHVYKARKKVVVLFFFTVHVVAMSKSTISCNVFGQSCLHFTRDTFVARILDVVLSFRILLLYRSSQNFLQVRYCIIL